MKWIFRLSLALSLIFMSACEKYRSGYGGGGKKSGDVAGKGGAPSADGLPPPTVKPTQILLANAKFQGKEASLQALVKFGGREIKQLPLTVAGTTAQLTVDGLPVTQNEVMTVELYEAEQIRFIAKRAATTLQANVENKLVFDDCLILKAPWDGQANEGSCGWTIEEVK